MLKISKSKSNRKLTVALSGRLDTSTAPELEQEMKGSLDGIEELTLDLKELSYISSAGLRVLLTLQKTMNRQGKMRIRNASDVVMEIFEVTGFSDILTIE